jgi:hypothetical protein
MRTTLRSTKKGHARDTKDNSPYAKSPNNSIVCLQANNQSKACNLI